MLRLAEAADTASPSTIKLHPRYLERFEVLPLGAIEDDMVIIPHWIAEPFEARQLKPDGLQCLSDVRHRCLKLLGGKLNRPFPAVCAAQVNTPLPFLGQSGSPVAVTTADCGTA